MTSPLQSRAVGILAAGPGESAVGEGCGRDAPAAREAQVLAELDAVFLNKGFLTQLS